MVNGDLEEEDEKEVEFVKIEADENFNQELCSGKVSP